MSGALALRANLWKLYLIQTCRWFLLLMPVLVLFYQENGLSLQDVFIVQAFFSICLIRSRVTPSFCQMSFRVRVSFAIPAPNSKTTKPSRAWIVCEIRLSNAAKPEYTWLDNEGESLSSRVLGSS